MKILYAATDTIAVPLLEALASRNLVRAVFTAPDAPGKRGKTLLPTPIKAKALELGLEVYTPQHLRTEERKLVRQLGADVLLSFCYGKIFGPKFLSLFKETFNVHPSLLPKYRGCSPIFGAICNGDSSTAISVQRIAEGIDEGDIYSTLSLDLDGTETVESLENRVANLAPQLVLDTLDRLDSIPPRPQEGEATYTGFITKDESVMDWNKSARELHCLIRAMYPWPKAQTHFNGERLLITGVYGSAFDSFEKSQEAPGTVVALVKGKGLKVATGDGYLYVTRVLPAMKKEMDAASFVNGARTIIGAVLN